MATPAAILSILVKAEGVAGVSRSLSTVQEGLVQTNVQGAKAEKRLLSVGAAGKTAGSGLATAAKHAAGFAAAYAGFRGIEKSIQTTEDLGKSALTLSKSFGLAADEASRWAAVSRARGTEGNKLTMGFKQLSTQVRSAAGGSKEASKTFQELGISQKELRGAGGDLSQILKMVSDGLADMPAGTEKAAVQARLFGRTWLALSPLIRDGSGAMDEQLKTADKYGATLGGKGVKAIQDTIRAQREAKLASIGLQLTLGRLLIPVVDKVVEGFARFVEQFRAGTGSAGAFRRAIDSILQVLSPFGESIQQIVGFLKQNEAVAQPLIGILVGLAAAQLAWNTVMEANPIFQVITALGLLTVGLVTAYRESATFRNIVDTLFSYLQSAAPTALTVATAAFNALKVVIQAIGVAAQAVFPTLATAFTATVGAITTATQAAVGEVAQWDVLWSAIGRGAGIMVAIVKAQLAVLTVAFRVALFALAPIATAAWKLVQGIFSAAWAAIKGIVTGGLTAVRGVILVFGGLLKGDFGQMWDGVKTIFRGAIKALAGILDGAWKIMKAPVDAIGAGLHDAFAHSWDRIKSVFESSINAVIDFLNVLIKAVNAIPGVPDIKPIGNIGGGGGGGRQKQQNLGQTGHLARGGAFRRTKGIVNQPITLMGEEAPTHPEFVIPTNPAYRKRAQGLLGQAAGAIGMAQGGVWSKGELMSLWRQVNDGLGDANLMAAIALAESGGRQSIVNSIGAGGLWQIYPPEPGYLDPKTNAEIAGRKLRTQGLQAWVAYTNGAYKQFMGGKGILDKVGGLLSGGIDSILGAFPKVNDAMGIFKGLGSYVLGKATAWAKDKVGNLFSTGGGGQGLVAKGPKGVGSFMGVPMANWVIESLQYAQSKGVTVRPTSGYRPGFDPHTASGRSEHQGTQYPHGAVDFGGYNTGGAMKRAVTAATASFKYPLLNPIGFHDEGHASGTGHAMGGIFSYLGSFRDGGITDKTGMALLHANEAVLPLASGGMTGTRGIVTTRNNTTSLVSALGKFRPPTDARGRPLRPGQIPRGFGDPGITPPAAAAPADEGGISAAEQAMLDAIAAQTAAMEENTRIQNLVHDQQDIITANQNKILAMAGQGDRILAAVVAAVNGGIGGKAGLGFQSVSYSGGMARYK